MTGGCGAAASSPQAPAVEASCTWGLSSVDVTVGTSCSWSERVGSAGACGLRGSSGMSALLDGEAADNDPGEDREDQHDHHQRERRPPGASLSCREGLAGVAEDLGGQGGVLPVEQARVGG